MPKSLICFVVAGAALIVVACSSHIGRPVARSDSKPAHFGFTVQRDVRYSPSDWPAPLLADIFQPNRSKGLAPAVLLIHGGGWAAPDRRQQMESIAERLAERGYWVMNVNYRYAPEYVYPAQIDDLQQAIAWMRQHQSQYCIDGQRIAAFGYSAGGHLAAQLGGIQAPAALRVQAVVAGGAPTDLRKFTGGTLVPHFLGGTLKEVPRQFVAASPISHVSADDPPVFLYHGGMDLLVAPDHATDYYAALQRAGVQSELFILRGREHISTFFTDGPAVAAALNFLDSVLAPPAEGALLACRRSG